MSHLQRRFSPLQMLLISINGMIGSAWLFAPLYAAKIAGAGAIVAWVLGGLITSLIALTFAELSTLLPVAGGTTRFAQLSHGSLTAFLMSWIAWLSCVTMPPIEVQATLQYASTYIPSLTYLKNGMPVLSGLGLCWATVIMFLLCVVNVASYKGLVRFNFALFFFKVMAILLTIVMLIKMQFHPSNFSNIRMDSTAGWETILSALASGGIAFAFTGFKHGVELAGETKNSQVAIPLAIVGSVISCLILYLGLQIAFIGALDPSALKLGWEHLSFSGDVGPFVGIAALLGIGWLVKLLYIDAVVSPLGAGLIYVTSTARLIYAMSKNHYLPKQFTYLNNQKFPIWAIGLNFAVGMFLFLPLPGWQPMVSFLVSAVVISYAIGPIALLSLRRQLPHEKRSFRLPAANVLCLLAFYSCNLISYWTGWSTLWKLAIAISLGISFFLIKQWHSKENAIKVSFKSSSWIVPYLIGLTLISYFGSFGGKGIIPFGWDFLVIALFSLIILRVAIAVRQPEVTEEFNSYKVAEVEAILPVQ